MQRFFAMLATSFPASAQTIQPISDPFDTSLFTPEVGWTFLAIIFAFILIYALISINYHRAKEEEARRGPFSDDPEVRNRWLKNAADEDPGFGVYAGLPLSDEDLRNRSYPVDSRSPKGKPDPLTS